MTKMISLVRTMCVTAIVSLLTQSVWAALTTDFLYTGSGNGSTTGWITGWDGEPFADARRAIGPGNMGLVYAAEHVDDSNKWHPYKGYQVPATFSIAFYTDLSAVSNPDTETAALFAAGRNSGDRAILYKRGNKVGVATNGGDVETDVPAGGYHLYTFTYTSDKITLTIDNGTPVEKTGTFSRPATGFQIAGIYGGIGSWSNPSGLPVAAVAGFAKVLTADDMTELTTTYPATTESSYSNGSYNTNGGKLFAGTITQNGFIEIKRGTLVVPAGAHYQVKAIGFGDAQGETQGFGIELDGEMTITGTCTKTGNGGAGIKAGVEGNEGGFLGGEWEGVGTFNIRGTLSIPNSYMQLVYDANKQTYNIENGGKLIVKGIQANKGAGNKARSSHEVNVKNGGLLQVKTALSLGTINANIEEGGTLELTDTFDHMLNNSNLGGVTCAGKLKLTGTNWVMLPTDATKAANLAAIAEIENNISGNNGQILLPAAQTFTIGSLSGTGGVRGDYSPNSARTLKIVQSKDTTWSGAVKEDSNSARIINFEVASENGSTLTMSGTYTGNNVRTGVLTVDEGGAVKLTKVWPTAGFNVNGTLTIEHGVWQPVYMVKGTGTINWAGTDTFSVNAADGDDALILDGTTINQTAGTLSLRAPGNRTADAAPNAIGYIKNATITSSSTLSCSGKIGVKGACSITKTDGTCSISTIELSEEDATLVLSGVEMTVTSGVAHMHVAGDGTESNPYSLAKDQVTITIPAITGAVAKVNDTVVEGSITVDYGTTVTIVYEPTTGYQIGATTSVELGEITANVEEVDVSSIEVSKIQVTITIPAVANTTVAVTGGTLEGNTVTVDYGTEITVTYTPATNYVGGGTVNLMATSNVELDTTDVETPALRQPATIQVKDWAVSGYTLNGVDVTPMTGDTIEYPTTLPNGNGQWGDNGTKVKGYAVIANREMNWKSDIGTMTINNGIQVYFFDGTVAAGANITGEGTLSLMYSKTISGETTITATVVKGTGVYAEANPHFILSEGATLKVKEELPVDITSAVDSKKVVFNEETLTYSLATKTFTITITPVANTTVTVDGEASTASSVTVDYGTDVTIVYTADENYKLSGEGSFSLTNVTADTTVGAGLSAVLDVTTITIPTVDNMTAAVVDGEGKAITITVNTITVTIGSTFTVTYTPAEGYQGEPISTGYTASTSTEVVAPSAPVPVPPAPKATVTTLEKAGLDSAYTFTMDANESAATSAYYSEWDADFVVTFDKDVAAGSLKLSGQYDNNGEEWADLTIGDVAEGTEIKLISMVAAQLGYEGLTVPYSMIRDTVQVFNCGVKNISTDNAGTKMTVSLVLTNGGKSLVIGTPVTYTLVMPEVEITPSTEEIVIETPMGADSIVITSDDVVVEEGATSIPLTTGLYTVSAKKGETVVATEQIGVIAAKEETTTKETTTAVAVPFEGATVANLLNTALLAKGDMLSAYVDGKYAQWKLTADGWAGVEIIGERDALLDTTALKRGTAVWVTTKGQIVVLGKYNKDAEIVAPVEGETNLLANPKMEEYTPEVKPTDPQDQVVEIGTAAPVRYTKKGGKWTKPGTITINGIEVNGPVEGNPVIPVGKGFWFIKK